MRPLVVLVVLAAAAAADPGAGPPTEVRFPFVLSEHGVADVDGDGAQDLVAVGVGGEVRVSRRGGAFAGALDLPAPARTLIAVADVLGSGRPGLAALSPAGLTAYAPGPDGTFAGPGISVAPRAKFVLRVGRPRFADFLRDVNGDRRPDLLLPTGETYEVWLAEAPAEAGSAPRFRKAAVVKAGLQRGREFAGEDLSDQWEEAFRIPYLHFSDVNGDGRPDLVVADDKSRSFHLQKADGSVPPEPDVRLDLGIFRDTTPEASLTPGRTLAGGWDATLSVRDLDRDGIPDYVIAHRRKIWVFHGARDGPAFVAPSAILKTAEDLTTLAVVRLDEDEWPDLLLIRIEVPTVAGLLKALYFEWEVTIGAVGYASREGRTFEPVPKWRGTLRVRLPEIVGVLRNPEGVLNRFEDASAKFRASLRADFDGDGAEDAALLSEDGARIEVWRNAGGGAADETGLAGLFFSGEERVWSLDDALGWFAGLAERQAARVTGGRPPDVTLALPGPADGPPPALAAADLDGDGRREIVAVTPGAEGAVFRMFSIWFVGR